MYESMINFEDDICSFLEGYFGRRCDTVSLCLRTMTWDFGSDNYVLLDLEANKGYGNITVHFDSKDYESGDLVADDHDNESTFFEPSIVREFLDDTPAGEYIDA